MNFCQNRIFCFLAMVLLFYPAGAGNLFADTGLTHIYDKEIGQSCPWFYGNWNVSYQDKELKTVTGIACVKGSGLQDVTIALRHPDTQSVYFLRSKKVELLPEHDNPEFIRIELVGQSPPSGADESGLSPEMEDMRNLKHRLTVLKGENLTIRYEQEPDEQGEEPIVAEKTVAVKDSNVSEGVWLTVELKIPKGQPPEKLTGIWSYSSSESQIKYNRAGTIYDKTTGTSSGEEVWTRPKPTVVSAAAEDADQMYVLFQGNDLPVQPGRSLEIYFEDPKVTFTGSYKTNPKDASKLYAQISLEPDVTRTYKRVLLNGRPVYCDLTKFYPVIAEREIMLKRKEADEKLAELTEAYNQAYNKGDKAGRAEAMRIKKEIDEHTKKTAKWFEDTEKERKKEEEEQAIRTKLAQQIRKKAAEIAEPELTEVMDSQDTKDAVTSKAEYVSIGAAMQEEMKKETRKSKRELVEAMAQMAAINERLNSTDNPPTQTERKILQQMWDNADLKRKAAERYLSDADKIAAAGYATDVALTVTGSKLSTILTRRQLAKQTAKQVAEETAASTGRKVVAEEAALATGKKSSAAAKPPVDPGATTILNNPMGKGTVAEGTEKIAAKGTAAKPPVEAGAKTIIEKPSATASTPKTSASKATAESGSKTILDRPLSEGAETAGTIIEKAPSSAAGSQTASETALRAQNRAAEEALSERLSRAAAEAERTFNKAAKEGVELSEAESARLVDAVVANNYNKSMNILVEQARKAGVSEARIAEATSAANFMPVRGGSVAIAELQRAIAAASNHNVVSGTQAAEVLQTIVRVQRGSAGEAEVTFLREAIEEASRSGRNYFDDLSRTGTVRQYDDLSTAGYETLASESEIEALKRFARQNNLID